MNIKAYMMFPHFINTLHLLNYTVIKSHLSNKRQIVEGIVAIKTFKNKAHFVWARGIKALVSQLSSNIMGNANGSNYLIQVSGQRVLYENSINFMAPGEIRNNCAFIILQTHIVAH